MMPKNVEYFVLEGDEMLELATIALSGSGINPEDHKLQLDEDPIWYLLYAQAAALIAIGEELVRFNDRSEGAL